MNEREEKMKLLLDGELGPEALEEDPILAKLAERIYGEDFLEQMGISRGEASRALSESLTEDEEEELMVEIVAGEDLPLPEPLPFEPPTNTLSSHPESSGNSKLPMIVGGLGLVVGASNMFGALSFLGSNCTGGGCPSDGHTRINWASIGNLDSGWGWSPSMMDGSYGIPDLALIGICAILIVKGLLRK